MLTWISDKDVELEIQPSRCAPTRQRGGKAATVKKDDCSVSIRSPAYLCEVPHYCEVGTQETL